MGERERERESEREKKQTGRERILCANECMRVCVSIVSVLVPGIGSRSFAAVEECMWIVDIAEHNGCLWTEKENKNQKTETQPHTHTYTREREREERGERERDLRFRLPSGLWDPV